MNKVESKPLIAGAVDQVDPLELLLRQVDNIITKEAGGSKSIGPGVKYSKLYSLATRSDMCLMYVGWALAALSGLGMPSFVFLIGYILDDFNSNTNTPE